MTCFAGTGALGASVSAGGRSTCDGSLAAAGAGAAFAGSFADFAISFAGSLAAVFAGSFAARRRSSPALAAVLVPFSLPPGSLIAATAASASAASFSFSFASITFCFSAASAFSASISSNSGFVLGEHRLGLKPAALNLCETFASPPGVSISISSLCCPFFLVEQYEST